MNQPAFHLSMPVVQDSGVIFASPHSGSHYPQDLLARSILDEHSIRSSEDAFVDQLFAAAPHHGAALICAGVPRAYVDFNRSPDELDPAVIAGVRPQGHNPRVASGLGVIPRVVANSQPIYRGKLTMEEARRRISTYWQPYHNEVQRLLRATRERVGQAVLVDCHSMPHEAMDGVARSTGRRADVVLGDRFGAAASSEVVDRIEAAFAAAGFVVSRNSPFAGAYVTQAYGRPSRNQHAVQIEIDRALYMDEVDIRPNADFEAVRARLEQVIGEIALIGREERPLAAE